MTFLKIPFTYGLNIDAFAFFKNRLDKVASWQRMQFLNNLIFSILFWVGGI